MLPNCAPPTPTSAPAENKGVFWVFFFAIESVFRFARNVLAILYPAIFRATPDAEAYVDAVCQLPCGMGSVPSFVLSVVLGAIIMLVSYEHNADWDYDDSDEYSSEGYTEPPAWRHDDPIYVYAHDGPPIFLILSPVHRGNPITKWIKSAWGLVLEYLAIIISLTCLVHGFRIVWGIFLCATKCAWKNVPTP